MTTKVTVDAHAGWPVEVTTIDLDQNGAPAPNSERKEVIPPHTVRDVYIHSHRELRIKELPFAAP